MGAIKEMMLEWMDDQGLTQKDLDEMDDVNAQFGVWLAQRTKKDRWNEIETDNLKGPGLVNLISWPESQGCIGCKFANLVHQTNLIESSTYICLAKDKSKVFCDNPEIKNE